MRLAEVLGVFAVAADVGMGMPMDHGLRSAAAAVRLGELAGASDEQRSDAFYLSLLRYLGCTSDSDIAAEVMGDEVEVRGKLYGVDWGAPTQMLPRMAGAIAEAKGLGKLGGYLHTVKGMPMLFGSARSHCEVGERLAAALGFPERVRSALAQTFERWDGKGFPDKLKGEAIALPMRLAQAGEELELGHRQGGDEAGIAYLRTRAKHTLDPALVELSAAHASKLCEPLNDPSPFRAALALEPVPQLMLDDAACDEALRVFADFADLKSRFTRTHSRGVARLARAAAAQLAASVELQRTIERAGLLHDLGRVAVSASIWDKPGPLSDAEWERVRMHTYVGERVLASAPALADVAAIATLAHERIDSSGYHRRLPGVACATPARVLAAADVFHALCEPRPHRAAHSVSAAANELRAMTKSGALCPEATDAVLAAAGQAEKRSTDRRNLSDRELEVLRLLARGLTNKEIASALDLSAKTVSRHLENIYQKIGVTTRAAATVVAMQRGLL